MRLQHLYNDTEHEHNSRKLVPRRRPPAVVVLKQTSVTRHRKNLEPTATRIDQRQKGIMEISSDTILTNVDHQKERQRRHIEQESQNNRVRKATYQSKPCKGRGHVSNMKAKDENMSRTPQRKPRPC